MLYETGNLFYIFVATGCLAALRVSDPVGAPVDYFDEATPQSDGSHDQITASAAGPDFPDLRGIDLDVFARPDSFSNVENGHGFVGGVYSDTVRVPVRMVTCE